MTNDKEYQLQARLKALDYAFKLAEAGENSLCSGEKFSASKIIKDAEEFYRFFMAEKSSASGS